MSSLFKLLGPGLISGAADNDPAGIATYTQVGAQFGYGQVWTALFALPLLTAVQEACARIGLVTGRGLAANIREHYGRSILLGAVLVLVVTNTINIGADIGAMTAAIQLLAPFPYVPLMLGSVALILALEVFSSYRTYARILKWLALAQLTYLATALVVREPWQEVARATFTPHIEWSFDFLLLAVGNIGTTIAPYLFFWEASQEAEEDHEKHRKGDKGQVRVTPGLVRRMRLDNAVGMVGSQVMTWSIMVTSATVLHNHGVTKVKTAAEAAKALEPLVSSFPHAGVLAKLLFAFGLITAGLLVIPIFAASAAYAVSEALGWRAGLHLKLKRAHGFYGVIVVSSVIGLVVNFIGIDVIKLLVYTSVLNGVASVPLLFLIARISNNPKVMGDHTGGRLSKAVLWLAFLTMVVVAASAALTMNSH